MFEWLQRIECLPAIVIALAGCAGVCVAEVKPMTPGRIAEAEAFGRRADWDAGIIRMDTCRTRGKAGIHIFDVTITTPFATVAYAAYDARKHASSIDLAQWPIDPPESQSVIVSVDPATVSQSGLEPELPVSVIKVVLRRGDQITEARRADIHQVLFPNLDEAHRVTRGGAWYFPIEPFASGLGDLEIVIVPDVDVPGAEAVLRLRKSELAGMR